MSQKRPKLDATSMPWQEFVAAYQIAMRALMGADAPSPVEMAQTDDEAASEEPDMTIAEVTGEIPQDVRERLQKDPYARVVLALREHFGPGYPFYRPFIYRFWSLYDLVHRGQLPEWVVPKEDGTMGLHPALLLAASDVKLTKKGKLPANRFRGRVRQIIAEELVKAESANETDPKEGASE